MKWRILFLMGVLVILIGCEKPDGVSFEKSQSGVTINGSLQEDGIYKLPVVFQILYGNAANSKQNAYSGRIYQILEGCNKYYKDMGIPVQLIPAYEDPGGRKLIEPGINRIQTESPVRDSKKFMSENNAVNVALIWDVDRYINVLLYTFSNSNVIGVAHLPYATSSHPLEGLTTLSYTPHYANLKYPYCISLNNDYINSTNHNLYDNNTLENTLAHELGHYLGLYHVFWGEDDTYIKDKDPDYCKDTPYYIRTEYEKERFSWVSWGGMEQLLTRRDCEGNIFISDNIMDYGYGYLNKFTKNQRERIEHVLQYSPLMPLARIDVTKSFPATLQDLPIRYMP
ncbi:MAG: zinc-dependent metalloproteinase lipoprotein [Bacteroidales bacterium]